MTLLVIDIQKGITNDRLYHFEDFVSNCQKIISTARNNNREVIYIQHDDGKGSGFSIGDEAFEISEYVTPRNDEKVFYKTINSCFGNKELEKYLAEKHEKTLMIIGLQTNFCIDASVKSAFERGYKVIIPSGTNSTFDNEYMNKETTYKYYNEMMWPRRFADCISVEQALKVLER